MPSKTRKPKAAQELPNIPKELIDQFVNGPMSAEAVNAAPMLYQRPGNLREMEWTELDLEAGLWTIPSLKMKRTLCHCPREL